MNRLLRTTVACGFWCASFASGAAAPPGLAMDYGPFLSSSVVTGKNDVLAAKAITISVGNGASVCYDTGLLRMAGAWTGGFLDLSRTHLGTMKGDSAARPPGPLLFATRQGPGWAAEGSFEDPRPGGVGPLPTGWAHYKGLHRHANQVVLSYSVGATDVLELPGSVTQGGQVYFTRTFRIGASERTLSVLVCDSEKAAMQNGVAAFDDTMAAGISGDAAHAALRVIDGKRIVLDVAPRAEAITVKLVIGPAAALPNLLKSVSPPDDLPALGHGGPSLWKQPIETGGVCAASQPPYVVDTIRLPEDNPWKSWIRPCGLDFFSDGRAAVSTLNGDVWIVSRIDNDLQHVTWKRFATGLYEPLGLKIVNDQVYVLGRDQITRLHDLDGDGEADFYENFCNLGVTSPIYHAFAFDLQADSQGNFWYVTDQNDVPPGVPMHGSVIKVSKDGKSIEVVATGLRAPNGTGMGPHDEFVCSDNEGNWIPACRINLVKPGGFYGFNGNPDLITDKSKVRTSYDPPLCYIPMPADNSTGGLTFVTGGKWGPLEGHMLSTSYGKCSLFEVMWEQVDGVAQGGVVRFPLNFDSGIMRARFSPLDGKLYVCGMKGWQTSGAKDGCFQRVRYTAKHVYMPSELHVKHDGIAITFTDRLDPATASDAENFAIEQWNYRWTGTYGSKDYKPSHHDQVGHEDVEVKSATLSDDRKTVFLSIPRLKPVMQMAIQVQIKAANGSPVQYEIDNTINKVPAASH